MSDPPAAWSPPAASKDELLSRSKDELRLHGEEGERSRSGRGFRGTLERRRGDPSGALSDVASAAAMAGWFRSEAASGATPTAAPARATGVAAAGGVNRILIGSGSGGAEARIRIGAGALAGTEIQLCSVAAGRFIEAQLLTHAASSRQTLTVVLDEIRSRLRERGIVLSAKTPPGRSAARPPDVEIADDRLVGRSSGTQR